MVLSLHSRNRYSLKLRYYEVTTHHPRYWENVSYGYILSNKQNKWLSIDNGGGFAVYNPGRKWVQQTQGTERRIFSEPNYVCGNQPPRMVWVALCWRERRELNPQPFVYQPNALPLSYVPREVPVFPGCQLVKGDGPCLKAVGAAYGSWTHTISLEGRCATVTLMPRVFTKVVDEV